MAERGTETQLIPFAELATGQAASIRNSAIEAVVRDAAKLWKKPVTEMIVRDLLPKDHLDYSLATWHEKTGSSTAAYESMSTGTMASRRFVGIYGVKDDSEEVSVTKIRITVGNSIKAIWQLENLYNSDGDTRIGFSPSVVIIPELVPYTISRYVNVANRPTVIVLKGFVVEPRGKVISP